MTEQCKKYQPFPIGTPHIEGDKKCGCCDTAYSRAEIVLTGHFKYGIYWINCANCISTLAITEEKKP